jgi:hypothetical protein
MIVWGVLTARGIQAETNLSPIRIHATSGANRHLMYIRKKLENIERSQPN